jgi:hypothetical protein
MAEPVCGVPVPFPLRGRDWVAGSASTRRRMFLGVLMVDCPAERAGTNVRTKVQGDVHREAAACASEASRSARDGVDLDEGEQGGRNGVGGPLPHNACGEGVPVRRSERRDPCRIARQNVDLEGRVRCVLAEKRGGARTVSSAEEFGKTTTLVSTAFALPLNGVSDATALTTVASDTAQAATSPTLA